MTQEQHDAQTKIIDGHNYRCHMLDPLTATDMIADLGMLFGPSLGALGGALLSQHSGDGKDAKGILSHIMDEGGPQLGSALEKAIVEFVTRLDKSKQREFINTLSDVTYVIHNGQDVKLRPVLTVHFRGRIAALYQWFGWALKVQFSDFFTPLAGVIKRVGQVVVQE